VIAAPLVDRVALWVLVPSVFLPGIALIAFPSDSPLWTPNSVAIVVYLFVLLGSMTVNAWLRLRQPNVLFRRALTRRGSIFTYATAGFAATVLVLVLIYLRLPDWVVVVIGLAGVILSILSWADSLSDQQVFDEPPYGGALPARARLLLSLGAVVLVAAAVSLLFAAPKFATIFNDANVALLLLGLPWSHPIFFVLSIFFTLPEIVMPTALAVCVLANAVLVLLWAHNSQFRLRAMQWFFRLYRLRAPKRGTVPMSAD
jgi:hypothetical protein